MSEPIIENVMVYGFGWSMIAAKYPMCTETHPYRKSIGADYDLATRLGNAPIGSGHDCYLKGIIAQFDLTFSRQAWLDALRYHFFDIVSSESTMHMLPKMKCSFTPDTDERVIKAFTEVLEEYKTTPSEDNWKKIIYSYPVGLQLTARVTTNYLQLKTMYNQRKNHRLPEWKEFCQTLLDDEKFPDFVKLCLGGNNK